MKIMKFYGNTCMQCNMLDDFMKQEGLVADELISTDDTPEKAFEFDIMGQPTLLVMDGDTEVARMVGYNPGRMQEVRDLFAKKG